MKIKATFKQYFQLTKPGIIAGNLVSVAGGFFLAAGNFINYSLLFFTLIGVYLVVSSGCVFNNYIDKDIDRKMNRTRNRALVKNLVSEKASLIYASLLGVNGFLLLWMHTNNLVVVLAMLGFLIYVVIYTLFLKRHSTYSILVGSLSGAIPPVIGYCAVTYKLDAVALILLLIFTVWQIPHSYAIAIFRIDDYRAAEIPILPIVRGISTTKNRIILYILCFSCVTLILPLSGITGYKYSTISLIVNIYWFFTALFGYKKKQEKVWARKVFLCSIISIVTISIAMSFDSRPYA